MRVPEIIREVLDVTGLTQGELAKEVGASQGTISKWISEIQSPNKTQWDGVLSFIAGDSRTVHLLTAAGGPSFVRVPLLDMVSAGRLTDPAAAIPVEDAPLLAFADLGRGDFFALKVEGSSMDRISPEGAVILVNKSNRTLVNGKPYVFSVRGKTTFKLWHAEPTYLAPYSTDPVHQPVFIRRKKDLDVIGRVVRSVLDL